MPPILRASLIPLALLVLALPARATDVVQLRFEHQHPTRWGESLYLLGDRPELGGGDPTRALRMVPGPDHRWTLTVALPPGASYRYVFLVRWNDPETLGDPGNQRWVSAVQDGRAPGASRQRRVRVRYLSGFSQVALRYRVSAGQEAEVDLRRAGPGRDAGEWLWEGEVTTDLGELELMLHDRAGRRDTAAGGAWYRTGYGSFSLAEGRLHPGAPDLDLLTRPEGGRVVRVSDWRSRHLGNAREVLIYLPRGYDRRPARRYPVVYMHDGQNLFGAGGPFGSWKVEETLDRLIEAGRLEELIVVGVGNTAVRMREYVPDADGGDAAAYGRFLTEELKPWVDAHLRTLAGREHTAVLGSSLGGIVSLHVAWSHPDVFGQAASLSGSFWLRRWVEDVLAAGPRRDLRVWLDSGTAGPSADSLEHTLWVRDALLRQGYTLGGDLGHLVDVGAAHTESAWRGRVGRVLGFLFPAGSVSGATAP